MCGRYYIETGTWDAVGKDFPYLKRNELSVSAGDITPAMESGALIPDGTGLQAKKLKWGYPGFKRSGLIINARAEGIYDKSLFSDCIRNRRCVLPAAGFYEWDRSKQKVRFELTESPVLYLAGIFRPIGEMLHFVIITREANASMLPVHDRMPLMIAKENVKDWICDPAATKELLAHSLPELTAKMEYEQLSLF